MNNKFKMTSDDWVRIGLTSNWLNKESAWGDVKQLFTKAPDLTPAQQQAVDSEKEQKQQQLDLIKMIESYANKMLSIHQNLMNVYNEIDSDRGMLAYIDQLQNGAQINKNLKYITTVAQTAKVANQTILQELEKITHPWQGEGIKPEAPAASPETPAQPAAQPAPQQEAISPINEDREMDSKKFADILQNSDWKAFAEMLTEEDRLGWRDLFYKAARSFGR